MYLVLKELNIKNTFISFQNVEKTDPEKPFNDNDKSGSNAK